MVAVSEPLLGLRVRNPRGELFLPTEIPGRVPRQFGMPLAAAESESSESRRMYEAQLKSPKIDGKSYGVWVDFPQRNTSLGTQQVSLSIGATGEVSKYSLHPDDATMTAVAATLSGRDLKRDPTLQIHIHHEASVKIAPQAWLVPKLGDVKQEQVEAFFSDPVALSPDGKKLWAVVDTDQLGCWSVDDNQLLYSFSNAPQAILAGNSRIRALAVGQDVIAIACAPRHIYILDAESGECRHRWEVRNQNLNSLQIFDNDQTVLFGSENGVIGSVQVATGKITTHYRTSSPVISVSIAGDERRMLYATADGTLASWQPTGSDAWEIDFKLQVTEAMLTDAVISTAAIAYQVVGESAPVMVDLNAVIESLDELGF